MKLFTRLFAGLFLFEMTLYGLAVVSHGEHPALFFLIIPAIWIGMAVGGVHSAGALSFVVGIAVTALFYALVTSLVVFVARLVLGSKIPEPESGQE